MGKKVAIIGAGGIGFDVAHYLTHSEVENSMTVQEFAKEWGIDLDFAHIGGIKKESFDPPKREIYLLKRSKGKHGANLGKTTGWIHRKVLKMKAVNMLGTVKYEAINDQGLLISMKGEQQQLEVDHVIICAGQEALSELYVPLKVKGVSVHLIGGAKEARELDAKKAIDEAARLVVKL